MVIEINTIDPPEIDWNAVGKERIIQNVRNLLQTVRYDVPYDRTLGLSADLPDESGEGLSAVLLNLVSELISRKEPRATVLSVVVNAIDASGNLIMKVEVDV